MTMELRLSSHQSYIPVDPASLALPTTNVSAVIAQPENVRDPLWAKTASLITTVTQAYTATILKVTMTAVPNALT